ncbi:tape measure protein [Moraxella bovis]|uniref:tape measure protein n=1 Tax=Moraxella bovis TaxID=476 RepID=UPI000992436B|nr:tape measure protein [Moraxella bovis]OOR89839.1 tail length tape measure protein [Moraxella bovis]
MAKVLSRLDILLHANTANYVREMKKATDKTKKELKSVADYGKLVGSHLGMAFAGLGSAVSISHIMQTADRMQDLASKVRINTQTTEEYNAVLQDLRKISTDYWTTIDGVTDLYASSKRALDSLGASQRQVLDFTRNITMAMSVGGGSAQAQEAALVQLGQAMSMGALRGQEFNSVSAQAPVIIDLLTDSLKVSRGELREMAKDGKITSQVMMDAVLGGYDKLQETINKMPTTFAQGIQNIKSQYDFLVDDIMNQNSLLSQNLASVALWVAENFRTLVGVGTAMGAVWLANIAKNSALVTSFVGLTGATLANTKASIANAFSVQGQINAYNVLSTRMMLLRLTKAHYIDLTKTAMATTTAYARSLVGLAGSFNTATASARLHTLALAGVTTAKRTAMGVGILATRAVTGLGSAFVSLGRIITAHPILALTAVIGAVIARTEGLGGAVKSLGDAFSVAGVLAMDFVGGVVDGLGTAWTATANYFDNLIGGSANATNFAQTAFGGFFTGTHKGFVGVGQIIARTFDLGGATVVWFVNSANKNIRALGVSVVNVFKGIGNFAISVFEKIVHGIIDEINSLSKGANFVLGAFSDKSIPMIGKESFARYTYATPDFGSAGNIASYNSHYLENKWVDTYQQMQDKAKQASSANLALGTSLNNVASASEKAGKGAKKLADANKQATKATDDLTKALQKAYEDQMSAWGKTLWDLKTPFVTELSQLEYEIKYGKFQGLGETLQDELRKWAKKVDVDLADFEIRKILEANKREVELMYSHGSKYLEMLYDLNDEYNKLSLASETAKREMLQSAIFIDLKNREKDTQDQINDIGRELKALSVPDGIAREFVIIEQQQIQTLEKYNYLLKDGYTDYYNAVKEGLDILATDQKRLVITKQYNDLIQSLKTDEQKRLDTLKEQLNVLTAHNQVMGANLDIERAKQLISQSVGLTTPANPYKELNDKTASQYASLDAGLQSLLDNERLTEQERINIKQWGADERLKIEKAHSLAMNALVLGDGETMFSGLASITKDGLGEQSRLYRAMFAMQQGFAIGTALLNMHKAISDAFAQGTTLAEKFAGIATATAQGARIVSAIKSVIMPVGQAHDGIMSVPKSGTWNLEKGERVLPRHTAKALDDKLNSLQNVGGGVVINQHITINADGSHDVKDDSQNQMGQALKTGVLAIIHGEMRQGRSIYNFVNGRR